MISTKFVEAAGKTYALKLGTRAMMRVEEALDRGFVAVLMSLNGDRMRFGTVVTILAAAMNDGKGAPVDDAADLVDELGGVAKATEIIGWLAEAAFPDAVSAEGEAAPAKNPKRTG